MVEKNPRSAALLRSNIRLLDCAASAEVHAVDAVRFLRQLTSAQRHFDIAFVDPPYRDHALREQIVQALRQAPIITQFIYVEASSATAVEQAALGLGELVKSTRSGDAHAGLIDVHR